MMQKKRKYKYFRGSNKSNNNQNSNDSRDYGENSNTNMSSNEKSLNNPFENKYPAENPSNYENFNQFDAERNDNWVNQNNNQRNYRNQRSWRGYHDRRFGSGRSFDNSYTEKNFNESQTENNQSRTSRRARYQPKFWHRNNKISKEDVPESLENNFQMDNTANANDEKHQDETENITNDKNEKQNYIESCNSEYPTSTPKKTSTENSENKTSKKTPSENKVNKSDTEKSTEKVNLPLPLSKLKKEPKSSSSEDSSSEDSSSDSLDCSESSDNDKHSKKNSKAVGSKIENKNTGIKEDKKKIVKKEKIDKKEDEIVCLGELKRFEDLADENSSNSNIQNFCILCEKQGHISFQCFMECKNCSEKYHNLKMCQKPANLSIMLQNFMEFCWMQCYQYDPEHKFEFLRDNFPIELIPGLNLSNQFVDKGSISGSKKSNKKKRRRKYISGSKKDDSDSTSDSSSESSSDEAPKKRKKKKIEKTPYQMPPFFPMGTPHFNPLAAAAMMGFNPATYMGKKD